MSKFQLQESESEAEERQMNRQKLKHITVHSEPRIWASIFIGNQFERGQTKADAREEQVEADAREEQVDVGL